MIKDQPINETLQELASIERDIDSLTSRLKSGTLSNKQMARNHKYLFQALELKHEIIKLLQEEYCEAITCEKLMFDLQNNY